MRGQRLHRNSPVILRGVLRKVFTLGPVSAAKNQEAAMAGISHQVAARGRVRFLEDQIPDALNKSAFEQEPRQSGLRITKVKDGDLGKKC